MKKNFKGSVAFAGKKMAKNLVHSAIFFIALGTGSMYAQAFTESMGSVGSTTAISTQEAANGFDNDAFTMTGTADVRNTSASSGYTGASGAANIFFTNSGSRTFQIAGINSSGIANPVLSFGILKSTTASNGSDFIVELSTDGVTYSAVSFPALPTGSGTAVWRLRTVTSAIPQAANLRIRFTNTGTATQYRIDDVKLTCSASITPSGVTTLCSGSTVDLTATSAVGGSYLWSDSETTQTITASASATFTVQVTDGSGCVAASDPVRVLVYPAPALLANASVDTICPGDSVVLSARTLAKDLFFSEYVEGSGNEKYIEIFNGTGVAVDLSDYRYDAFHNGVSAPTFSFTLSDTLDNDSVLVLRNPGSTGYTGGITDTRILHNGDDAIGLFKISTGEYVDIFGVIGQDPGSAWTGTSSYSTQDQTLRRKSNVYSGISVNPALPGVSGFSTLNSEWDLFDTDDVTGLGTHTMNGAYSWSPATIPSTGSPVKDAPASTTTYTVTGTYVNECSSTNTVTVVVRESCGERTMNISENTNVISAEAYPNPFSNSVNINFSTTVAGPVSVTVKDVTGRVVAVLFNDQLSEGRHSISWTPDANQMGNGVYFCEISAGNERQTMKVMYNK
jgi:hypothetical protein